MYWSAIAHPWHHSCERINHTAVHSAWCQSPLGAAVPTDLSGEQPVLRSSVPSHVAWYTVKQRPESLSTREALSPLQHAARRELLSPRQCCTARYPWLQVVPTFENYLLDVGYNDPARAVQHSVHVVLNAPRSSPQGEAKARTWPCRPPDFHTRPRRRASRNGDDVTQLEGKRTNWNPYHRRGSTNICLPQASHISMPDVARSTLIVDHTMPNTGAGGHQSGLLRS